MNKKILLVALASASLFAANINIDMMDQNPDRQYPSKSDMVLSYNSSIKDAQQSVVNIATTKEAKQNTQLNQMLKNPLFKQFFGNNFQNLQPRKKKTHSLGSGVIVTSDGYIITNNHVVEGASEVIVSLSNDTKEYKAKIIGTDPKTDIAVIKIEKKNLEAIKFANSNNIQVGDVVFAIGNPFGVGESVTSGIISALNKSNIGLNQYENFIQTDASINPGNSGGALIDSRGALIGINSAILSSSGGNNGIGFAIPSIMVKQIATTLVKSGKIERGYIGVSISNLTSDLKEIYKSDIGALILNVEDNSPAFKGGLHRGDLILQIDEEKVKDANDLKNIIGNHNPGSIIKMKYERDGKINTTSIKLINMDRNSVLQGINNGKIDGLILEKLTEKLKYKYQIPSNIYGVLITGVKDGSKAASFGFMPGDIIVQVNQKSIKNISDIKKALQKNKKNIIFVNRNGYHQAIVIK